MMNYFPHLFTGNICKISYSLIFKIDFSSGAGVVVPVVNTGLGMFAPLLGMANESSPEPTTPIVQIEQPNQREPSASSRPVSIIILSV